MEVLNIIEWLKTKENSCKLIRGHFVIMENDSFIITNDHALTSEQVKELHARYTLNKKNDRGIKNR